MATLYIAQTVQHIEIIRTLFTEYQQWLNFSLCFQGFDKELAELPGKYSSPRGRLYLAEDEGKIAGCIALRPMEETGVCEMKRLFVKEEFRGKKIGRILAEKIITDAKEIGYSTMKLDTLQRMETARSLYTKLGFVVTTPYYNNPIDETVYMELKLLNKSMM
jgi:ribosomal protein S18 acetylase RimI-like enzyme